MQLSRDAFNRVAGLPQDGIFGGQDTSGRALMFKRRQFLMQNQFLFEEQAKTLKRLVSHVISLIKKYWSVEKIIRIVQSPSTTNKDLTDSERNVVALDAEALRKILSTQDDVKFDIVISESVHTETMRDFAFASLTEMAQQGMPIPPDKIIETSPFPNRNELINAIRAQNAASAQSADETATSETFKSLPESVQVEMVQQGIVPETIRKLAPMYFQQKQMATIGPQTPEQLQEMQQLSQPQQRGIA
jgi:hypothetical protein